MRTNSIVLHKQLEKQLDQIIKENREKLVEVGASDYDLKAYDWNTADLKTHMLVLDSYIDRIDAEATFQDFDDMQKYGVYLRLREWLLKHKSNTGQMLNIFIGELLKKQLQPEPETKFN